MTSSKSKMLGIIPSRKGSKGLPGKATRLLMGKPLIAYTLEAAIETEGLEPLVSSDDPEVLKIADSLGISTQYERPGEISEDTTTMTEVLSHVMGWRKNQNKPLPSVTILLQPTSPFRKSEDILGAYDLILKTEAHSVIGVSPMWNHPYECIRCKPNSEAWSYLAEPPRTEMPLRRQDYVEYNGKLNDRFYFINGAIYGFWTEAYLKDHCHIRHDSALYKMSSLNTVDIDTIEDLRIAEALGSLSSQVNA